jgi:hypothetical protein
MDRLFTVCYLPSCLLLLALTMRYSNVVTARARILAGFIGFTVLLVLVPLVSLLNRQPWTWLLWQREGRIAAECCPSAAAGPPHAGRWPPRVAEGPLPPAGP